MTNGAAFVILDKNGNPIPVSLPARSTGLSTAHSSTRLSAGTTLQATDKEKIFDHDNYFVFGGSIDHSYFSFSSNSTLGNIQHNLLVFPDGSFAGSGDVIRTAGDIGYVPTWLTGTTTYYGLFTLDTFNITPEFAATAGARLNIANIDTQDASGGFAPELTSANNFDRINPVVGLTYQIAPWISAYGGYSEANRAPTPLELDCADKLHPCLLANSLVSDPPLSQVVSHTIEAGLRGSGAVLDDAKVTLEGWSVSHAQRQRHRLAGEHDHRTGLLRQCAGDPAGGRGSLARIPEGRFDRLHQLRPCRCDLPLHRRTRLAEQPLRRRQRQCAGDARRSHSGHSAQHSKVRRRICLHVEIQGGRRCAHRRQPVLHRRQFKPQSAAAALLDDQSPRLLSGHRQHPDLWTGQ